jgi:uncharacterized protein YidB (DUF937 family)
MPTNLDEVVTDALVNAIAVAGRQISSPTFTGHRPDADILTARWFETLRLTGDQPELPDLSPMSAGRLAVVLSGDEVQAALQKLLAARLTDTPETDAAQAWEAVRAVLSAACPDSDAFVEALASYYDKRICALVARLKAEEQPMLARIRSGAFSSGMVSVLHAIERNTATRAGQFNVPIAGSHGVQAGEHNTQVIVIGERGDLRTASGPASGVSTKRLLAEVTDPFDLEVHRPVQADDPQPGLPELPTYVIREHDLRLAEAVKAAAAGNSGIVALVGGSSTGKTRACWEALELLRKRPEGWRLWHPIQPSPPEAALRELGSIGSLTVVWLNEAQFYLDAPGELGERIAAGLRELLRDRERAPVLVLATLWPQFWDRLTARPVAGADDPHAQVRELLAGRDITVPAAFTDAQLPLVAAAGDPRLALAAEVAENGRVVQFLAGAPELMARYRNAPPAAAALISSAMDARRLGMGVALPLAFLEAAAPGYLDDADWDVLPEDWLEQALAYTAAPAKGTRGPLTRIRPRTVGGTAPIPSPAYRLADYLEQHGRQGRRQYIPPASFWTAAARFAAIGDLPALANAAERRGLFRDAARLRKHASAQGDASEAAALVQHWHSLHPRTADPKPAQWVASRVALDSPGSVAELLDALWETGAGRSAAALLARDPASRVSLDNAFGVAQLLDALRRNGSGQQVKTLLARDPAVRVSLDDVFGVAQLLNALRRAGAGQQGAALARRAAAHVSFDNPFSVAWLLSALREAAAGQQVKTLLVRDPAVCVSLDDPFGVAQLLSALREADAGYQVNTLLARDPASRVSLDDAFGVAQLLNALQRTSGGQQAAALARRAAAHVSLANPGGVAQLLDALREAGAGQQAAALVRRAAAHVSLDDAFSVAWLLDALRRTGAGRQAAALVRHAVRVSLDDAFGVAQLLDALREAGAKRQAAALLARDPAACVSLDDAYGVVQLLDALREGNAEQQVRTLIDRLPAEGHFDLFLEQPEQRVQYRFGRQQDTSPAPPWDWDDLD